MSDERPSRLASPEIDERRILIGVVVSLLVTAVFMVILLVYYDTAGRGAQHPLVAHPFPAPQLETRPTGSPRMALTADPAGPHGRHHVDPAAANFQRLIGPAMATVATRGAGAYDPPAQAAR